LGEHVRAVDIIIANVIISFPTFPKWRPICVGLHKYGTTDIFLKSCSLFSQFIADIRGARVKELEEKRINKEMANIRKKFKGYGLNARLETLN